MKDTLKYFDCFAGIGGFHCAAKKIRSTRYSLKHVAFCEVERNAQLLYEAICCT